MQGTFCKVILTLMSEGMIKGQKAATTSFQDPTIPPSFGGRQANGLLWLSVRKTYGCSEGKLFVEAKGLRSVRNHLVQNLLLKSHQGLEYNGEPQWCREWTQETGCGRDNAGEPAGSEESYSKTKSTAGRPGQCLQQLGHPTLLNQQYSKQYSE